MNLFKRKYLIIKNKSIALNRLLLKYWRENIFIQTIAGQICASGNLEILTKEKNVSNQVSSIKSKFAVFSVY